MKATVHTPHAHRGIAVLTSFAISAVFAPALLFARDRPGTPTNEQAFECYDRLAKPPAVCVQFDNTASEPVTFNIEMTLDGDKVAHDDYKADCIPRSSELKRRCTGCEPLRQTARYDCEAFTWMRPSWRSMK